MSVFEHPGPAKDPDAIRSFVGTVQALVKVEAERDAALAQVARVRALCDYAADYEQLDFVDAIRVALEPPGSKPWTVQVPATSNSELPVAEEPS